MPKKQQNTKDISAVKNRLVKSVYEIATEEPTGQDIAYVSAPLCHVFFPYSNPGDETDFWIRSQGNFHLSVEATRVVNPETQQPERFGLPYGPKPRLILSLLNTVMLKQKSPEITLGNSLTGFINDHLGLTTDGRTINEVKNQLARLSTSLISATYKIEKNHTLHDSLKLIRGIDVWWNKDANQRHLWGNYLRFSDDYFNDVMAHGVPIDRRALSALSGSALGIDVYSFLAHRLHIIPVQKPLEISWQSMKDQFGQGYGRMDHFKEKFRQVLKLVHSVYQDARIEEVENRGFILYHSKPPIPPKTSLIVPDLYSSSEQTEPAPIIRPLSPFEDLHLKQDPTTLSPRKANEIQRQVEGKWDGVTNAKYKDVKKRKPKTS